MKLKLFCTLTFSLLMAQAAFAKTRSGRAVDVHPGERDSSTHEGQTVHEGQTSRLNELLDHSNGGTSGDAKDASQPKTVTREEKKIFQKDALPVQAVDILKEIPSKYKDSPLAGTEQRINNFAALVFAKAKDMEAESKAKNLKPGQDGYFSMDDAKISDLAEMVKAGIRRRALWKEGVDLSASGHITEQALGELAADLNGLTKGAADNIAAIREKLSDESVVIAEAKKLCANGANCSKTLVAALKDNPKSLAGTAVGTEAFKLVSNDLIRPFQEPFLETPQPSHYSTPQGYDSAVAEWKKAHSSKDDADGSKALREASLRDAETIKKSRECAL